MWCVAIIHKIHIIIKGWSKMKVGFINSIISKTSETYPIGLVSLCTVLGNKGVPCKILDFSVLYAEDDFNRNSINKYAELVCQENFSVISFYTMANSYHISLLVAEKVKKLDPKCIIIFAGPQASVCGEDTLKFFPFVDLIALGEGELTVYNTVINAHKREFNKCPNVLFKQGNRFVRTPTVPLINDLDRLPLLDYSYVPYIKNFKSIPIEVGRGCPFRCKFCSTKGFWNQNYRLKSSSRIIQEVEYLQAHYGINDYSFEHDSLTANRKQLVEFCNGLIEKNLGIVWGCSSRVDVLDEEVICLLSKAGCHKMFLGIESGSPTIQEKINKNLNLDEVVPIIKLLRQYNILPTCSFIYGFPEETETDLSQTLALISQLISAGVNYIQIHRLALLRGTEFYEQFKGNLKELDTAINITAGGYGKEFEEFIKKYPSVFPHFFKIDNVKYSDVYIEHFINYILKLLTKNYPFTYQVILDRYQNDLYRLYQDLICCFKELEDPIYHMLNEKAENERFKEALVNTLKRLFFESRWAHDHFMNEVFRFESDYLEWIKEPNHEFVKWYEYDIYEFINNGKNINPQPQKTQLSISMIDKRVYLEKLS